MIRIIVKLKLKLEVIENMDRIEGPAVVLVNHHSNIDWLIAAYVLKHTPVHFVTGRYLFRNPLKRKLFYMLGCIPKEQFYPDIQTVKMIKNVMKGNGVVALFPSGQSSFSGESTLVPFETAKLIKKLSVAVYHIHIDGAHLAFPKWDMTKIRKTPIVVSLKRMFTEEELQGVNEVEIYERLCTSLHFDDYEWQRERRVASKKSRTVEGIEYVLFMCPQCKAEFQMKAAGNILSCQSCGYSVNMDSYGFFSSRNLACPFDTPTQWYRWQFGEVARQTRSGAPYSFAVGAQFIKLTYTGKIVELREGSLLVSNGVLEFRGTESDGVIVRVDTRLQPILFQHESKYWFEIIHQNEIYRFKPIPKGAATKFVMLKELYYLAEKRNIAHEQGVINLFEKLIRNRTGNGTNAMGLAVPLTLEEPIVPVGAAAKYILAQKNTDLMI